MNRIRSLSLGKQLNVIINDSNEKSPANLSFDLNNCSDKKIFHMNMKSKKPLKIIRAEGNVNRNLATEVSTKPMEELDRKKNGARKGPKNLKTRYQ